ncbi:MAG: hypothetical protein IPF66_25250 [Holophagales bacterium]|nr:hypothetical protein [Holophagales bacterium]
MDFVRSTHRLVDLSKAATADLKYVLPATFLRPLDVIRVLVLQAGAEASSSARRSPLRLSRLLAASASRGSF